MDFHLCASYPLLYYSSWEYILDIVTTLTKSRYIWVASYFR